MKEASPHIFALSGESGCGKTALCVETIAVLRQVGVQVAGLVSPARFEHNAKAEIFVRDIGSGEQRRLAERCPGGRESTGLGWRFDPAALQWGMEILKNATPCDVLVVDELGPLECKYDKGWAVAWEVLNARDFLVAMVVVRPSLIPTLRDRLRGHDVDVIPVTPSSPTAETLSKSVMSHIGL